MAAARGLPALRPRQAARQAQQQALGTGACSSRPRRAAGRPPKAVPELLVSLSDAAHSLPLLYEPVAAPCSLMNCGDAIYRSTLDPVLRREVTGLDWRGLSLLGAAALYLFATPGPLVGAWDYYIMGPLLRCVRAGGPALARVGARWRAAGPGFGPDPLRPPPPPLARSLPAARSRPLAHRAAPSRPAGARSATPTPRRTSRWARSWAPAPLARCMSRRSRRPAAANPSPS
jgi:hypothetical protein